ncbi:MAG: DUF4832 domain-containing protein [Caldilineaceae bacterium]|nr:DUF4832 domain-containing protein [Caldilineaceae bacterium]
MRFIRYAVMLSGLAVLSITFVPSYAQSPDAAAQPMTLFLPFIQNEPGHSAPVNDEYVNDEYISDEPSFADATIPLMTEPSTLDETLDAAATTALSSPLATNDATSVYYQFRYSGSYTFYRAYIDTDQSVSTGLRTNGIGANFLLENNTLWQYTGNGTNWKWKKVKTITYANRNQTVTWTVARADIGESATPNRADLIFQVETTPTIISSSKLTHIYSNTIPPTPTPTRTPTRAPTSTPTRTATPTPTPAAVSTKIVTYSPTTALFANPERGFYRYYESRSSAPTVWSVAAIQNTNAVAWLTAEEEATITQAYCLFYLDSFLNGPINTTFLNHIRANLTNIRNAGRKCILRFAYTDNYTDSNNNGIPDILQNAALKTEPDLPQLLTHIDQLKPILQEYADVITLLQAGFIGLWGEWYYTDHFVDNPAQPDIISATQYERRKQVVQRLLTALPATRMIAVRYPQLKQKMFGRTTPITSSEAFQNTPIARIGVHNDAFLNSYGDSGTFSSSADRTYLQAESLYLPVGGEVNEPESGAPSRSCANALSEMGKYHWSYLNTDYYLPTLQSWKSSNCIHNTNNIAGSILDRLGYRFVLKKGSYSTAARPGGMLSLRLELVNEGFAALYNPRDLYLVLQNTSTGALLKAKLPDDPRYWLANGQTYVVARTVTLPTTLATGNYALYLHLADPATGLNDKPQYAIRLANANLWKSTSGWNDLQHTISVSSSARTETALADEGLLLVEAGLLLPSDDPTVIDLPVTSELSTLTEATTKPAFNTNLFLPLVVQTTP